MYWHWLFFKPVLSSVSTNYDVNDVISPAFVTTQRTNNNNNNRRIRPPIGQRQRPSRRLEALRRSPKNNKIRSEGQRSSEDEGHRGGVPMLSRSVLQLVISRNKSTLQTVQVSRPQWFMFDIHMLAVRMNNQLPTNCGVRRNAPSSMR